MSPIYDLICSSCGRRQEDRRLSESDKKDLREGVATCDFCHGRLTIGPPRCSFVLKGEGWSANKQANKETN